MIVYGSLYPWQLRDGLAGVNPLWTVLDSWPRHIDALMVRDIAVNTVVYLPLGVFAFLTFSSAWRSVALGFALSTLIEISQVYIVSRVPSAVDIASDTFGTCIGVAAALLWRRMRHSSTRRPDAVLLMCLWVLQECFPFVPRLRPVVEMTPTPEDLLLFLAEALALAVLVQGRRLALGCLLLTVPLRAFIYTRRVSVAEIACCAVVFGISWFVPVRAAVAAVVLGIAVVIHGLSPFIFLGAPHAFSWVPFQASFSSEWAPSLNIMLGKTFFYGTLLWLIRESGVRLVWATAATAVLLASIEVVQMYLPGRSSEIIDPLMALILGWVFSALTASELRAPPASRSVRRSQ